MASLPGYGSGPSSAPLVRAVGRGLDQRLRTGTGGLVNSLQENGIDLACAMWVLNEQTHEWRLWLAIPSLEQKGPRAILQQTDGIIERLNGSINIDVFDVDVISSNDPELGMIINFIGIK